MSQYQILVIDDDEGVVALVSEALEDQGFEVHSASSAKAGRGCLERSEFDLIVLDRTLPDGDGLDLCAELRKKPAKNALPILFLTAKNTVDDKIEGLRTGGDDYITKPFNTAELLARVEALLRRSGRMGKPESIVIGDLRLEMDSRKAYLKKRGIALWAKEFDLLALLVSQKNRVLSREFLLQQIWGYDPDSAPSTKVVDVTISHVRQKLGPHGDKIVTVRGFGYRFDP
ncbi:MAG: response regulator transcription factor [Elusimicrobiota bacterium]